MKIGIVAHTSRQQQAEALRDAVDADVFSLDDGSLGCEGNHAAVLADLCEVIEPEDDWIVVLEDDVELCPNFLRNLNTALALAPTPLVALYLGTGNPSGPVQRAVPVAFDKATATQSSWLVSPVAIPCVAYAVHAELAESLLVDALDMDGVEWPLRVSKWASMEAVTCSYAHPSLVNHRDQGSVIGASIDPWSRQPRRAHAVVGNRTPWTAKAVPIHLNNCPPWSDVTVRAPAPGEIASNIADALTAIHASANTPPPARPVDTVATRAVEQLPSGNPAGETGTVPAAAAKKTGTVNVS